MQSPGGIMIVRSVDVTGALRETQRVREFSSNFAPVAPAASPTVPGCRGALVQVSPKYTILLQPRIGEMANC